MCLITHKPNSCPNQASKGTDGPARRTQHHPGQPTLGRSWRPRASAMRASTAPSACDGTRGSRALARGRLPPVPAITCRRPTPIPSTCTPTISSAFCPNGRSTTGSRHRMYSIHCAAPASGEHVVHIGTGTGYYTAILAHLVGPSGWVTGIEYDCELAARAKANLAPASKRRSRPRGTAPWLRSTRPMSFMSMPAARDRPRAGSIVSPTAVAGSCP